MAEDWVDEGSEAGVKALLCGTGSSASEHEGRPLSEAERK